MSAWVHNWLYCKEAKTKSKQNICWFLANLSLFKSIDHGNMHSIPGQRSNWYLGVHMLNICPNKFLTRLTWSVLLRRPKAFLRSGLCFLRALGKADDIWKTPNGCLKSRNWNEIKFDQYWNSKVKSLRQWIRQNTSWQTDLTAILALAIIYVELTLRLLNRLVLTLWGC